MNRIFAASTFLLEGCTALTDLSGLCALGDEVTYLSMTRCAGLTTLASLPPLPAITMLSAQGCAGLEDLAGIEGLAALEEVRLGGCTALTTLDALAFSMH